MDCDEEGLIDSWVLSWSQRQSKKNGDSGSSPRTASTSCFRPKRRIVIWKGCGAPSGRSAIAHVGGIAFARQTKQLAVRSLRLGSCAMSRDEAPAFPLRDVWMIVVPVLPLIVFTVLTASLFDPAERLGFLDIARDRFVAQPQREYVHLGDMLTYYAVAAFHTLLCLSVIAVLVRWLRGLPARAARSGAVFSARYGAPCFR